MWLRSGHLQTIAIGYFAGPPRTEQATQHIVPLEDGDAIVLHEDAPASSSLAPATPKRVAILIHGLTGCHASPYVQRLAFKLNQAGVHTYRMDMRGCGAGSQLARDLCHAGRSADALAAMRFVANRHREAILMPVGFSLGAAVLLRTLGEFANELPDEVRHAFAVSPPIDLRDCCLRIQRGLSRWYDRTLARWLYQRVQERKALHKALAELDNGSPPRTIWDFDEQFTAPLGGFRSAEHYYHECSSLPLLTNIRVPTTILTADDDPVVPGHGLSEASLPATIQHWRTRHGGHLGYYAARNKDPDQWWMDWRIVEFALSRM